MFSLQVFILVNSCLKIEVLQFSLWMSDLLDLHIFREINTKKYYRQIAEPLIIVNLVFGKLSSVEMRIYVTLSNKPAFKWYLMFGYSACASYFAHYIKCSPAFLNTACPVPTDIPAPLPSFCLLLTSQRLCGSPCFVCVIVVSAVVCTLATYDHESFKVDS